MVAGARGQLAARAAVKGLTTLSGPWAIQGRGRLERMRGIGAFVAPLSEVKPSTLEMDRLPRRCLEGLAACRSATVLTMSWHEWAADQGRKRRRRAVESAELSGSCRPMASTVKLCFVVW
jgi:hypothetical protein